MRRTGKREIHRSVERDRRPKEGKERWVRGRKWKETEGRRRKEGEAKDVKEGGKMKNIMWTGMEKEKSEEVVVEERK